MTREFYTVLKLNFKGRIRRDGDIATVGKDHDDHDHDHDDDHDHDIHDERLVSKFAPVLKSLFYIIFQTDI